MRIIVLFTLIYIAGVSNLIAQNTRIIDHNQLGWYNYFGNFKIAEKFSIHTEYQLRRDNFISDKQQGLLRLGLNYNANPKVQFRLGYAWIETYPYGEYPLNGMGKDFTEQRIFEMVTLTDKISIVDFSHRFMFEQRFIGSYSSIDLKKEDTYTYVNRFRYMIRLQIPLKGSSIADKTPYIAFYEEVFIGFGNNVNENIFDQNRIGLLLGYKFKSDFRLEGGYFNQTVQLGREINGSNVFQSNNGLIINCILNFDLTKKKK